MWLGKLTALDKTPLGWLGRKTSTQTKTAIGMDSVGMVSLTIQVCRQAKTVLMVHAIITKTCLYNFEPLKPHFYIVKLGFTGYTLFFLISSQKHRLWYSLEPPRRGGSNEYLQSVFWAEIWKISEFLSENFQFLEVKFSTYLHREVMFWSPLRGLPRDLLGMSGHKNDVFPTSPQRHS